MPDTLKIQPNESPEEARNSSLPKLRSGPSVYVNHAEVGFSCWDMRLRLGEMIGMEDDKLIVEEKVQVVMSLHHAKAFIHMLHENLQQFEERHGEIPLISPQESS